MIAAEPLYLSLWLNGFSPLALPVYFRKAVSRFPVSKLRPQAAFRIVPVSSREPSLLEEEFEADAGLADLSSIVQEHLHQDCMYQVETFWDIWQFNEEWELKPSRVSIEIYGPDFETDYGEQIRFELGPESLYLPDPRSDQLRPVQSNIRSVLHLADDSESELSIEKRLLWSDSESNIAERLRDMLD